MQNIAELLVYTVQQYQVCFFPAGKKTTVVITPY